MGMFVVRPTFSFTFLSPRETCLFVRPYCLVSWMFPLSAGITVNLFEGSQKSNSAGRDSFRNC